MKKIFFGIICASVLNIPANADFVQTGGFNGEVKITTVQDASKLRDDSPVVLQGNIINSLGDEKYTFTDQTGQITIEIDDEDWRGINVTPDTTVEIYGEVDKGFFKKTKIDVNSIRVK